MSHYFYDLTHFRELGRNTEIFSFVFWFNWRHPKVILKLSDLYRPLLYAKMTIWLCSFWKMFNPGSILHAIWPWNWKVWTKVPKKLLKDKHFLSKLIWSVLRYTMKTLTSRMVWAEIHADSNSDPNVQNTSNCAPMWYRLKQKDIDPWI